MAAAAGVVLGGRVGVLGEGSRKPVVVVVDGRWCVACLVELLMCGNDEKWYMIPQHKYQEFPQRVGPYPFRVPNAVHSATRERAAVF